jgi:two-component system NtrC family sensor kinase
LIIDEEAEVGALLADMLDGYSCTLVESAREGLALLEGENFDVILSDLRMPGMNGYEFAQALATRRPELVERVIFVTGDTLGELRAQVESLGRPVIDKPFAAEELLETVARVR